MELKPEKVNDVTVIPVPVEFLDTSNTREFKDKITPILATVKNLVLDLRAVNFIDSTGVGALLTVLKQLSTFGGDLKLCCVAKPVRALFELIRMHRIVEIFPTREEAIAAFAKKEGH